MEGRGGRSGKGSRENKTCKSKNMTGAARVGDCGGHPCSTVPAALRAVPAVTVGVCVPLPPTHTALTASPQQGHSTEQGQPPAGPVAVFGSELGQQNRGHNRAQVTPGPQDDAALGGACVARAVLLLQGSAAPQPNRPLASTAQPHSCRDTLCPQAGHCSHAPGALCFAFPPALGKGCPTWHFPGAGGREQTLLGASSQNEPEVI